MTDVTAINSAIASWDGKSADDIGVIYQRCVDRSDFIEELIAALKSDHLQRGASWLLKAYCEDKRELPGRQIQRIYRLLPELSDWQAKLQLLQSMHYMKIGKAEKVIVETFLTACLNDDNKFVRAWSYHGFYELALQYPEYLVRTKQYFRMAMRDEAASVKARLRNIIKQGFDIEG